MELGWLGRGVAQTPKQICMREVPKARLAEMFAEETWTSPILIQ